MSRRPALVLQIPGQIGKGDGEGTARVGDIGDATPRQGVKVETQQSSNNIGRAALLAHVDITNRELETSHDLITQKLSSDVKQIPMISNIHGTFVNTRDGADSSTDIGNTPLSMMTDGATKTIEGDKNLYTSTIASSPLTLPQNIQPQTNQNLSFSPHAQTIDHTTFDPKTLQFIRKLGEGTGGAVDQVLHVPSQTYMARKGFAMSFTGSQTPEQLQREVSALQRCRSPYIVQYYGSVRGEEVQILMEYCDAGSLLDIYQTIKRRGGLAGEKVLAAIAHSVLMGLDYLHQSKIIHRDIKPSNILLTYTGQVKLCDLGVSGELVDSIARTFAGTAFYMAPERMKNEGYGIKSDIWSLGMTLMEVSLNRYPIEAPDGGQLTPFDLLGHIMFHPLKLPPDGANGSWTKAFRHFLESCLERDPQARMYPSELLQHPWIIKNSQLAFDMARFLQQIK